jgi:DNA (cytosine-5)-methyltransferase 1
MRKRPKWFLWENVPGVLSSTGGSDFAAILSGFTGTDVEPQKFTTSGIISGPFYRVAWRVLDSQYIGVPQRRRRVFVVGHLGNDWRPSAAVLFERESMRGHTAPRKRTRQETARTAEDSVGTANYTYCPYVDTVGTLQARDFKGVGNQFVGEGKLIIMRQNFCISGNTVDRATRQNGTGVTDKGVFTLTKTDRHAVVYEAQAFGWQNSASQGDSVGSVSPTLDKSKTPAVVYDTTQITSPVNGSNPQPGDPVHTLAKGQRAPSLVQGCLNPSAPNYVVRRLTPLECERLQGFPDIYTNVAGLSDSARYAAIGNSMTVNVMRWIGKRINYVHYCLSL